jgi:hypothetical protein
MLPTFDLKKTKLKNTRRKPEKLSKLVIENQYNK